MTAILRTVSVSGGKDSTALYLWAIEQFGKDGFLAVFADTGHEHPVTLNYVRNLPEMAGGPAISWVRADFRQRLRKRFTTENDKRTPGAKALYKRLRPWLAERDYSSGNTFLDLIIWKGRVPASRSQFCTEHLKLEPIREWLASVRGDAEVHQYVGIRAGESLRRSKMPEEDHNAYFDCTVKRPLLHWSEADVFDYLRAKGIEPNPLYAAGFKRVGCFPCIHSRKSELAMLPEWAWDKLEEWERVIGRSWFAPGHIPISAEAKKELAGLDRKDPEQYARFVKLIVPTTTQVRAWSKTTRGGAIIDMFAPDEADVPSCMSTWGTCE